MVYVSQRQAYMRSHYENTHIALHTIMRQLIYQLERACAVTYSQSMQTTRAAFHWGNVLIDFDGFRVRDSPPC
jgi:hypothetical protein